MTSPQAPGPDPTPPPAPASQAGSEPAFNAPWIVLALAVVMTLCHLAQTQLGGPGVLLDLGFAPKDLALGRYETLVTALFLHGGWLHLFMNAAGAVAFGAPVARLLGAGPGGSASFFMFYLLCGVVGSLGYAALHPNGVDVLIGASGAVSGLMGAASRLIERRGRLSPYLSRSVLGMGAAWLVVNLLIAVIGSAPGSGGAAVAWEAHLAGYAAGLVLIGPLARILRRG